MEALFYFKPASPAKLLIEARDALLSLLLFGFPFECEFLLCFEIVPSDICLFE